MSSLLPAALAAQSPEREPAVLELVSSTRAVALGGAYQLGASDADLLFHNPSLLERARGISLGVHVLGSASLAATVSGAAEWGGGGVGAGLQVLEYGRLSPEEGARGGGLDPLVQDGPYAVTEMVASAGYGRRISGMRFGFAAKLIDQRVMRERDQSFAVDLGASREVSGVTLGIAVQDLGPELEVMGKGKLPTRLTVGAGRYGRQLGPLDVGGAAAVTLRADGELVPGGGIEIGYWPITGRTFVARLGAHRLPEGEGSPFTFGGAYWGDSLVLDYAFQPLDGEGGVHRITVGWR